MATIDIKLKTYEQLQFEIMKLNTDIVLKDKQLDKYKNVIDKIKEYIEKNKYKKMGGYGDNEDEDIEECLFEDDIWEIEKLLEEVE